MGIPPHSGCAKGGEDQGLGGIHRTEAEYGGAVHHHPYHNGPLPGSGEAPGG